LATLKSLEPLEANLQVSAFYDSINIPYMITGSFASDVHSVPRATYDADIVIEFSKDSLEKFLNSLSDHFYVSHEAAREALESRGMFNVIHLDTGFKVDLIMRKDRDFSRKEFSRREKVGYLDADRWFASAEDIILAKLEWSKSFFNRSNARFSFAASFTFPVSCRRFLFFRGHHFIGRG
jgi:hypothetical protein